MTHKDRTLLLQYVQGKEFKDTLRSIFKAFNLSYQEITYYRKYLNKIYIPELIKGTHSLRLSVRDMVGDPMAFSSKKGFLWPNDGYDQSESYVRIAICNEP